MEEHDHEWCAHISQKKDHLTTSRVINELTILWKVSYTIPEWPLDERCGEWIKVKINVFLSKTRSVFRWKSSTKEGKSTLTNGLRCQRAAMVSINGATRMLGANACIVHIPLHEQMLVHNAIVLMEVE